MRYLLVLTTVIASCASNSHQENIDLGIQSDTLSLFYKGKPAFIFGKGINALNPGISFYNDTLTTPSPNSNVYLTADTFFMEKQSTGIIIGNLSIETDQSNNINRVYGHWAVSVSISDSTETEAINAIRKKYFPALPIEFKRTKTFSLKHQKFSEELAFYPSPDSGDVDHGYIPHWSFTYYAK